MRRAAFLGIATALLLQARAAARTDSTVVVVASNIPDLSTELEAFLADALRRRGVDVVDSSSIDTTYYERVRAAILETPDFAAVSYSDVAWVKTTYHSANAFLAEVRFDENNLAYGEFTVDVVRAVASYRCFNAGTKRVLGAGSFTGQARGEDGDAARDTAAHTALLNLARNAAEQLL